MAWQQPHWQETKENNLTHFSRIYIPKSWTEEENTGQFRYEFAITTPNRIEVDSLHCRVIDTESNIDVLQEFYLKQGKEDKYKKNNLEKQTWPTSHILYVPIELTMPKNYDHYFKSLTQQVPTLEHSLRDITKLLAEKYEIR